MPPLNDFQRSCLALAISQAIALPAAAATITVDSTDDVPLASPSSDCTLRQAISSANSDSISLIGGCQRFGSGTEDIIRFSDTIISGSTITLTEGELHVTSNITINGRGQDNLTISGNNESRVFYVDAFNIDDKTGEIYTGALTLNGLTVTGGSTSDAGGGIFSIGDNASINITNSTVSGNSGGGVLSYGGNASLSITNSTISDNSTTGYGGGVFSSGTNSSLSITNSTVSGNSANKGGGGVGFYGVNANLSITNSTVSGNSGKFGGGITSFSTDSSLSITNSTVSGNSAYAGSGVYSRGYNANLTNSIIAGNLSSNGIEVLIDHATADISNNLLGSNAVTYAEAFNFRPNSTNIIATSDELNLPLNQIIEPLADNGGTTLTHALPAGSPAIERASQCPATDQRGVQRGQGSLFVPIIAQNGNIATVVLGEDCDIGAVEFD